MSTARAPAEDLTPPPIGNLEQHPPSRILAALGRLRFTGELRFTVGQKTHSIDVRGGAPTDTPEAARAMELFLEAVAGPYELRPQVPLLPGALRKDASTIGGSLADVGPAELLNFCEEIGLTGKLELDSAGRECVARYARGELESITVDGQDDAALDAVFRWSDGHYQIHQRNAFEEESSSVTELRPALGTIELALSEILARSAKGQGGSKPKPKTIPPSIAPPPASPDQSVKIIFRAPKLERDSKTAHVSTQSSREVVSLDAASSTGPLDDARAEAIVARARQAERERSASEPEPASAPSSPRDATSSSRAPSAGPAASSEAPSRALSIGLAVALLLAIALALWSLGSMAGSAR
jgi:hypothetical protein